MAKSSTKDLTTGSPMKLILGFMLPLLLGMLFQQFYNMVDSWVVGNFVGTSAMAAVGIAFPIIFLLTSLFIGMAVGTSILIAQFFGAGDRDGVRRSVDTVYGAHLAADPAGSAGLRPHPAAYPGAGERI